MNFRSDNEAPINPQILQAIVAANQGFEESYGYDPYTEQFTEQCQQLFQCWCEVLPLTTGTAANANDFTAGELTQVVTIAAAATSETFDVTPLDDSVWDTDAGAGVGSRAGAGSTPTP